MAILWCGQEEIDFAANTGFSVNTSGANYFRTGYARAGLVPATGAGAYLGMSFPAARTSFWYTFRVWSPLIGSAQRFFAFTNGGADRLGLKCSGASPSTVKLVTWNGAAETTLATSTLTIANSVGTARKFDLQVDSYGATATVRLYVDGTLFIEYSGDVTAGGATNLDGAVFRASSTSTGYYWSYSEVILADEDTRLFSLATLAPSAAGDANAWTGDYTAIDEVTLDDSDVIYTDTADLDFLCALSDLPAGTFTVKAVRIAARAAMGASGISGVKLGIKSGGTVDVDAAHTLTASWATPAIERLMAQNPVTANNWTTSEVDALQIALRSAT